jgi:hypothetical protein
MKQPSAFCDPDFKDISKVWHMREGLGPGSTSIANYSLFTILRAGALRQDRTLLVTVHLMCDRGSEQCAVTRGSEGSRVL